MAKVLPALQSPAGGDACQPFSDERGVDEHTRLEEHVEETPAVGVMQLAIAAQAHPAMQDERLESLTRLDGKRRGLLERAAEFRRIDAEQPDAPDTGRVDGVTVDDASNEGNEVTITRRRGPQEHDDEMSHTVASAMRSPLADASNVGVMCQAPRAMVQILRRTNKEPTVKTHNGP